MHIDSLRELLDGVRAGRVSVEAATEQWAAALTSQSPTATAALANVQLDLDRAGRCGFPEVLFAEGKTPQTLVEIFGRLREAGQASLATRVNAEQARRLLEEFPAAVHNECARTVRINDVRPETGRVVVITAGTSDRSVAEEALETLRWMHCGCELIADIGVAGPQRLIEQLPRLGEADAIVVVAGMEGALPSVVGGWVACPVIAVPTGVGYGAAFSGVAALLGMLNSCAANVCVVNIDAGFKGGFIAGLIAHHRQETRA